MPFFRRRSTSRFRRDFLDSTPSLRRTLSRTSSRRAPPSTDIFNVLSDIGPAFEKMARKGKLQSQKGALLHRNARVLWDEAFGAAWPNHLYQLENSRRWELGMRLLDNFHILGVDRTSCDPAGHRSRELKLQLAESWATTINNRNAELDHLQADIATKRAQLSELHAYTSYHHIRASSRSDNQFAKEEAWLKVDVANSSEKWKNGLFDLQQEIRRFEKATT